MTSTNLAKLIISLSVIKTFAYLFCGDEKMIFGFKKIISRFIYIRQLFDSQIFVVAHQFQHKKEEALYRRTL